MFLKFFKRIKLKPFEHENNINRLDRVISVAKSFQIKHNLKNGKPYPEYLKNYADVS